LKVSGLSVQSSSSSAGVPSLTKTSSATLKRPNVKTDAGSAVDSSVAAAAAASSLQISASSMTALLMLELCVKSSG